MVPDTEVKNIWRPESFFVLLVNIIVFVWWHGLFTVPELWLQDSLSDVAEIEVRFITVWAISKEFTENKWKDHAYTAYLYAA